MPSISDQESADAVNPRDQDVSSKLLVSHSETLPDLLNKLRPRIHAGLLAYLVGLLFVIVLGSMEIRCVEVCRDSLVPLAPDSPIPLDRRELIPDPDGAKWIIYAQQSWVAGSIRISRWTYDDNHPDGRFVCWSSPPMWWMDLIALPVHFIGHLPMTEAIDRVAPHYNTFIWMFAAATLGWICVLAYGWRGALIIPLLYSALFQTKYGIFSPDHHLWILLSALGMLVCMSAPFVRMGECRQKAWFVAAGLFTAFGFWISAPSMAVVLIGLFTGFLFLPSSAAARVTPSSWRLFGYVSSLLTLLAYAFEFLPEISIHIETNNPVYSASLLVGGIWFWQAHKFAASGRRFDSINPRWLVYSAIGLLVMATPLFVNLPHCFSLANPYFQRWESQIAEEQPIEIQSFLLRYTLLSAALFSAIAALFSSSQGRSTQIRVSVSFITGLAVVHGYFGISSNRFMEVVIACGCVIVALGMPSSRKELASCLAALFAFLFCFSSVHRSSSVTKTSIIYGTPDNLGDALNLRLLASHILTVDAGHGGAVLAPSNEGTFINLFSKLPVFGTAYWENQDGLLFTYSVLFGEMPVGQEGWPAIRAMMRGRNVRIIAIPKGFTYVSSYMIYGQDRITDPSHCFAYYLIHTEKEKLPAWLKLERDDEKYRIFTVVDAL